MKRLIVLLTVGLVATTSIGCACGPIDWLGRNTLGAVYEVDRHKAAEKEARSYENWPTTTLVLKNHAAVRSCVRLMYDFPGWIDPAKAQVIMNKYRLEYDVPPCFINNGEKRITVPAQVAIGMKVHNPANRKSYDVEVSSGSAIFNNVIDVTPYGAERVWYSRNTKAMLTFFNPTNKIGTLTIKPLDSGQYEREFSTFGDKFVSGESEKLIPLNPEPHVEIVMPGVTATASLFQGYYEVHLDLKGGHSLDQKIQVANGKVYDELGTRLPSAFSFYLQNNEPSVTARKLKVPHRY